MQIVTYPPNQPPRWFPWPRRTIIVVIILLAFVVVMMAAGAPPLVAVSAVVAITVMAVTGDVPAAAILRPERP
jgi:hypothetical protein